MVSGFDKYFQIAPCFRDEDARADRSQGVLSTWYWDVICQTRWYFQNNWGFNDWCFKTFSKNEILFKFPQIPFNEAMLKYGTDKPDLRNPLIIKDVTKILLGRM